MQVTTQAAACQGSHQPLAPRAALPPHSPLCTLLNAGTLLPCAMTVDPQLASVHAQLAALAADAGCSAAGHLHPSLLLWRTAVAIQPCKPAPTRFSHILGPQLQHAARPSVVFVAHTCKHFIVDGHLQQGTDFPRTEVTHSGRVAGSMVAAPEYAPGIGCGCTGGGRASVAPVTVSCTVYRCILQHCLGMLPSAGSPCLPCIELATTVAEPAQS